VGCGGHFEPVRILGERADAYRIDPDDPFDDHEHMLDLGAHARLGAVASLDRLILRSVAE